MNFDVIDAVQKLGFPIVIALIVSWFGYRFLIQVWQYVVKKLDEKDAQIDKMVNQSADHREKMIETQLDLSITQKDIKNILQQHTALISDIKHLHSNK